MLNDTSLIIVMHRFIKLIMLIWWACKTSVETVTKKRASEWSTVFNAPLIITAASSILSIQFPVGIHTTHTVSLLCLRYVPVEVDQCMQTFGEATDRYVRDAAQFQQTNLFFLLLCSGCSSCSCRTACASPHMQLSLVWRQLPWSTYINLHIHCLLATFFFK